MKTRKLISIIAIFVLIGGMSISVSAELTAITVFDSDSNSTSALDGSVVEVISDQIYTYSLTRSGRNRYDDFFITTSGASQFVVSIIPRPDLANIESNDDFDLYWRAGAFVAGCSTTTCSIYDDVSWDTGISEEIAVTNPSDMTHYFRVQRYAGSGQEYYDFVVSVTGGGGTGDTISPTVSLTSPTNAATVSETVVVSATANDNVGVDRVEFRIDGGLKATDTTSPYSFNWDTTTSSDGSHSVSVQAFDATGNSASDSISITVDNGIITPTGCGETPRITGSMPFWHDAIDAEKAHAEGCYGGDSVVVILDTGLNGATYPSLFPSGAINTQYSSSYTQSGGFDNVNWNQDTTEGHGTSVTATILGYNVPSSWGYTNNYAMGIAPNAEIVMLRVVFWVGAGVSYADMINNWAQAINDAVALHSNNPTFQNRGMTISMSLGYDPSLGGSANANLEAAIQNARLNGVVVSTSAGNDGPNPNTTGYPANINDATSVAAAGWTGLTGSYGVAGITTDLPEDDFSGLLIASFSSRGKVEITGMGWQLVLPSQDGSYYYISGTSFSCPQVSGVFAVMFGYYGSSSSVDFLESAMMTGAYNGPSGSSGSMTLSTWGAGFVQADGALGL